jgi:hypothetical protein
VAYKTLRWVAGVPWKQPTLLPKVTVMTVIYINYPLNLPSGANLAVTVILVESNI